MPIGGSERTVGRGGSGSTRRSHPNTPSPIRRQIENRQQSRQYSRNRAALIPCPQGSMIIVSRQVMPGGGRVVAIRTEMRQLPGELLPVYAGEGESFQDPGVATFVARRISTRWSFES